VDRAQIFQPLHSGNVRNVLMTLKKFVSMFLFMSGATALSHCAALAEDAEAYVVVHGGTIAPAGQLEIDGRRMVCGRATTVLDPTERDFGEARHGFIILNPDHFGGLATPVKLWIFSHECAHLSEGDDETKADCVAVKRGRKEGWLTVSGLDQVCEFMKPARGDQSHFTGEQRCALMRQCLEAHPADKRR
jgi:hypothetical protein